MEMSPDWNLIRFEQKLTSIVFFVLLWKTEHISEINMSKINKYIEMISQRSVHMDTHRY
jgi:hypothetical protein